MAKPSLSALIIAKDEERDLPGCLESLRGLATEIVVLVDASTSDRTEELARAAGAKTARRKFDDYARQRQAALDMCTGEWVLWIDADERVTPELARAIIAELDGIEATAFSLKFAVTFLGKRLRWGGLGWEWHVRLFDRKLCRFIGGKLHEGIEIPAGHRILKLAPWAVMLHEPYRDVEDYMSKLDRYTTLAAQKRYEAGRRFGPLDHLRPAWELFSRLVLKLGFLDGGPGLTWARLAAYHTRVKYAKLKQLEGGPR